MASLSLFTGPMGLFADMLSMQKTEITNAALPTESAAGPSSADTLAYRCHQSAVNAWLVAASAAKPLARTASRVALTAVALAGLVYRVAYILAALAARVANSIVLLARDAWACKRAERIRKKICFEIALVLLGPGGSLLLIVLWPGWAVFAAAVWALWAFA